MASKTGNLASFKSYDGENLEVSEVKTTGKQLSATLSYNGYKTIFMELPEAITMYGYKYAGEGTDYERKDKKQMDVVLGDDRPDNPIVKDLEQYQKTREMLNNLAKDIKTKVIQYMKNNHSDATVQKLLGKIGRSTKGVQDDDPKIHVPEIIKHPEEDYGPFKIMPKNRVQKDESGFSTDITDDKSRGWMSCIDEENGNVPFDIDKEGRDFGKGTRVKCHLKLSLIWIVPGDKVLKLYPDINFSKVVLKKRVLKVDSSKSNMLNLPSELDEDDELISKALNETSLTSSEKQNAIPLSKDNDDEDEPDAGVSEDEEPV